MKGFYAAQQGHFVNIIPPKDINGAVTNSDVFSMENHGHASILLQFGVTGAAVTVTLEACDDFVPTNVAAIPFKVFKEETDAGDTLDGGTDVAAAGFAASTNNNIMYVIEVDAAELPAGKPNLRLVLSDPGAATLGAASVLLSGSRYAGDQNATAIA